MRFLALLSILAAPVLAGQGESKLDPKRVERYNAALKLQDHADPAVRAKVKAEMEALAEEGHPGAGNWLGHYYLRLDPAQPETALRWFLRGA